MNIKIKALVVYAVVLTATFYAGMMMPRPEKTATPAKPAPQKTPFAATAPATSPTPPPQAVHSDPYGLLPDSAAAKLSPDELGALLQNNPTAIGYARDISGDVNFNYLAIDIARKWAADDPSGAVAWAQGLPAGPGHDDAIKLIFTMYGTKDLAAATALAQSLPADGSNVRSLALNGLANIAVITSIQDPAQAAAMLTTLGNVETGISGENPTAMVAAGWLMRDPQAATQWIDTLPVGNTKDSAILALVDVSAESDPATAFTWLRTMSNAGTRGTTTTQLITQWAKMDPDSATAAVMQAYPNNNNGRQAALLAIIAQARAATTNGPPGS